MPEPLVGGRYEIRARLGRGGMGSVYHAVDRRLMREVALKVMAGQGEPGDDQAFLFQREARAAAALQHPGIVQIFDYSGPDEHPAFIVMELVRGQTLQAILAQRRQLLEPLLLAILHQLAAALEHAHAQGVMHRDLKPGNILIEGNGRVALTDFGLAKAYRDPVALGRTVAGRQTGITGTPGYMAPEQILNGQSGPESDIFALGCVAYAMAQGASPFAHPSAVECMRRTAELEYLRLDEARPELGRDISGLIGDCLAVDLLDRPEASQVAARALALLHQRGCPDPLTCVRLGVADQRSPPAASVPSATTTTEPLGAAGAGAAAMRSSSSRRRPATRTAAAVAVLVGTAVVVVVVVAVASRHGAEPEVPLRDAAPLQAEKQVSAAALPPQESAPAPASALEQAAAPPAAPGGKEPDSGAEARPRALHGGSAAAPVALEVVVRPWGTLFLDGQEVGNFPLVRVLRATPGRHQIVVVHPKRGRLLRSVVFGKEHLATFDFEAQ